MGTGIFFSLEALVYNLLLLYVFFGKKVFNNEENKIYSRMVIIIFFELFLEFLLFFIVPLYDKIEYISILFSKLYLMVLVGWIFYFSLYCVAISFTKKNENSNLFKKTKNLYVFLYIVFLVLNLFFKIEFFSSGDIVYTSGPCVYLTYAFFGIYLFLAIISIIFNRKEFKDKRLIPLIIFLVFGGICGIVQLNNPELLLATPIHAFITFLMYFTIENPDLMIIEELNNNRKLIEKTNEDKLNLLFELSQEVKQPINNIEQVCENSLKLEDVESIKNSLKTIKSNSKQLSLITNNVLNISNMDLSNIKITNVLYRPESVYKELVKRTEEKLNNKNIEFRYSYSKNIPDKLYGDSVKIKQILTSFLNNAVEMTKEGFIEFKINSIIKYDICRLIITIEDSGIGMDIDKVNEILSANIYEEGEFEVLDNVDIGTKMAHKIIKMLNGSLIVKSEPNKGSEFLIIIDQKIKEERKIETNDNYLRKNKVLVVDDKSNELKKIENILNNMGYDVTTTLYGKDAIEKTKNKEKYDLIIIDDEMNLKSGLDTLQELRKNKKFTTPVVIMIEENKKFIKEKYIEEGFKDYILKDNLEEELKKVVKYI